MRSAVAVRSAVSKSWRITMGERRLVLLLLAAAAVTVGLWAAVLPTSFFSAFPLGRDWVAADGAYNEHLVRDVGALHLALAVVTLVAWRRPTPTQIRAAAAAWLVFTAPHLAYHIVHADLLSLPDALAQTALLALQVIAPAWLLARPTPRDRPTSTAAGTLPAEGHGRSRTGDQGGRS